MNTDKPYEQFKEWARLLYTKEEHTTKEISSITGADQATIRNWINDGSWDVVRRSRLVFKETQVQNLYQMIEKIVEKDETEKTYKDLDQVVKLTNSIKNLETDHSVSHIIEVAELFIAWLRRRNLDLARKITPEFDRFIKQGAA
jgi:uncharacterized protein YerC